MTIQNGVLHTLVTGFLGQIITLYIQTIYLSLFFLNFLPSAIFGSQFHFSRSVFLKILNKMLSCTRRQCKMPIKHVLFSLLLTLECWFIVKRHITMTANNGCILC